MFTLCFAFASKHQLFRKKDDVCTPRLYGADQDYNFTSCASAEVTSRIKYLSVTVKAASYTALTRALRGMPLAAGTSERLGSELTAAGGARRSATSVASSSRKDAQNAAAPLT